MSVESFANRLKSARIMAGLSLEELAKKIDRQVSKQALQKYEKGLMKPDSSVLIALSKALNVKADYFFRTISVPVNEFEFRKKSKLAIKDEKAIKEISRDYIERYLELEFLLGLDKKYINPIKDTFINTAEDAERAASELRKAWELGNDAIPGLIETLEDNEIKVCEVDANESFDGLVASREDFSIIVINKTKEDLARKRLTIAHEIAHMLLNIETTDLSLKEKLCFRFAGAFLLPAEILIKELGHNRNSISLVELKSLKKEFGISMQAIIRRAFDLDIITASKYKSICIEFAKRGWSKKEPADYEGYEKPNRFWKLLLRAVSEDVISISKAASLANESIEQVNKRVDLIL